MKILHRLLPLLLLGACATTPPPAPAPAPEAPQPQAAPKATPAQPAAPVVATPPAPLPPFEGETKTVDPRAVTTIDRTVEPDDLWQRIRQGFAMPNLRSPLVKKKTAQFAANP